jgi:uncharacterized protein YgbK (DUF1537 family)
MNGGAGLKDTILSKLKEDRRIVFILDDDPTGSQAVSGVRVILKPEKRLYPQVWRNGERCAFVLTNTRSMNEADAVSLVGKIKRDIESAAAEDGVRAAFLLRGDSTLRGHVFAEMDVFRGPQTVGLFVPAYPECGRVTLDGVQYLVQDGVRRAVCESEFARDPVFGYRSRTLRDWTDEIGKGAWTPRLIPLAELRRRGAGAVAEALERVEPGTVVIPDAESDEDIASIALGMLMAEDNGADVIVRSAAAFAAVRCGLAPAAVRPGPPSSGGILIVCGSHTAASTRQLEQLMTYTGIEPVVVPAASLFREGIEPVASQAAKELSRQLADKGIALLASERIRDPAYSDLESGARVMKAITTIVSEVSSMCGAVIAKGGITSANVAVDGLAAETAFVRGQLLPGISLWDLPTVHRRSIPYAVIPGNMGDDGTMAAVAKMFGL